MEIKLEPTNKAKTSKEKINEGNGFSRIKASKRGKIVCVKKIEIALIISFTILLN